MLIIISIYNGDSCISPIDSGGWCSIAQGALDWHITVMGVYFDTCLISCNFMYNPLNPIYLIRCCQPLCISITWVPLWCSRTPYVGSTTGKVNVYIRYYGNLKDWWGSVLQLSHNRMYYIQHVSSICFSTLKHVQKMQWKVFCEKS